MSDKQYFDKFAISQSSLKDWKILSPLKWFKTWITKELKRSVSSATTLGSFLDCLMFTPEEIDKRFIIAEVKLPSPKVKLILDQAFAHITELNKNAKLLNEKNKAENNNKAIIPYKKPTLQDKDLIVALCNEHDHYKDKADQAYNDVLKKGSDYFEFLKKTKGRTVITPEDNLLAAELKKILLESPVSKGFFIPKKGCEVIFQQKIFAEFPISNLENVEFLPTKGAIDIVHFNHKRKQVREVDLKFINSSAFLFWDSIKRFDYPQQHSFYAYLMREWLKTYKEGEYADYDIMNPLNVVIDGDEKTPYIYAYNTDDLDIKRYGVPGTPIRGWEDTINDIAWHFDTGDWSRPREHQQNGFLSVKIFNRSK